MFEFLYFHNTQMDIEQYMNLLHFVVLAFFYMMTNDIMHTIKFMVCPSIKSESCFANTAIYWVVMMGCTIKIFDTWLKTLLVLQNKDEKDENKSNEELQEPEESKAELA